MLQSPPAVGWSATLIRRVRRVPISISTTAPRALVTCEAPARRAGRPRSPPPARGFETSCRDFEPCGSRGEEVGGEETAICDHIKEKEGGHLACQAVAHLRNGASRKVSEGWSRIRLTSTRPSPYCSPRKPYSIRAGARRTSAAGPRASSPIRRPAAQAVITLLGRLTMGWADACNLPARGFPESGSPLRVHVQP